MDSSESVLLLAQQNELLMVQQEAFREIIQQLTKENGTLREQNTALAVQNSTYLELLKRNQDQKSPTHSEAKESTNVVKEMQRTIEALQERVIALIQEKLSMQMFIEDLEHTLAMTSPHAAPKTMSKKKQPVHKEKIRPELPLDDTCTSDSQPECLETARRQQQAQLLLDNGNVSRPQPVIDDENYNPLLGEFDIRKELEEQFDKRTIVGRPADEFERSLRNQGVATSRFLRGGKMETSTGPIQEAMEGNEKQRSRHWIGRIGFKQGGQGAPTTVVKPAEQGLGNRQVALDAVMMMECKDEIIQHSKYQREATVSDVIGKRSRDKSGTNISTDMNLLL